MDMKDYYLCVFESKNHAMYLMAALEASGNKNFQLVSTPCGIKAGCSYSVRFSHKSYYQVIKKMIEKLNLEKPRIIFVEKINGKNKFKEILF